MSLLVADASPVVGFATANEHPLLWQVVSTLYGQLLVPHHVDREISRTAAKTSRKAAMNYAWMKQQGQPTVLAEVTVVDPVAATAATLLGVGARRQFGEREKDVGEALTVTGLLARLIPESPLAMSTHPAVRVENAGCCSRICNSSRSVARARVWWSLGGSAATATSRGPV